jgi:hypothetical protein
MRTIELHVVVYPIKAVSVFNPYISYEWFGLKDQFKRIRRWRELEQ